MLIYFSKFKIKTWNFSFKFYFFKYKTFDPDLAPYKNNIKKRIEFSRSEGGTAHTQYRIHSNSWRQIDILFSIYQVKSSQLCSNGRFFFITTEQMEEQLERPQKSPMNFLCYGTCSAGKMYCC